MSSLQIRLRKIDETRDYLLEEIKHDDLISEKYKKTCKYLNYVEHLPILSTGCVSMFTFASLVCVPIGITKFLRPLLTYVLAMTNLFQ